LGMNLKKIQGTMMGVPSNRCSFDIYMLCKSDEQC